MNIRYGVTGLLARYGFVGLLAQMVSLSAAHASALVQIDEKNGVMTVIAHMIYTIEPGAEDVSQAATDEISRMWNEPGAKVTLKGKTYDVKFNITRRVSVNPPNATSCAYNFIKVQTMKSPGDRSFYRGLGAQNGVFFTSDDIGHSTTAAHEFGHGLMLEHNYPDQRAAEVPGIMFARGTLVKPQYQWDPTASAGGPGGTVNPIYRKVRAEDVTAIPFEGIHFTSNQLGCIGDGSPVMTRALLRAMMQ